MKTIAIAVFALLALCAGAQAQGYSTPAQQRYSPYDANLPGCDEPGVLARITNTFEQKESEFWGSALEIGGYDHIREIGFRANGLGYIPRRYCVARAKLSDSKTHTVIYIVQEDMGIIGWGYGVEWCVVGLDRNLAYAPACEVLRPYLERFLGEKADKVVRALY